MKRVLQSLDPGARKKDLNGKILLSVHKNKRNVIDIKPYFAELIQTIQTEALKYSETLILSHFREGMDMQNYLSYIHTLGCDGMIVLATELEEKEISFYQQLNLPVIILDNALNLTDTDMISLDGQTDFMNAMTYAYKRGYRKFGYLKSEVRTNNYEQHMLGFYEQAHIFGIEKKELMIIEMPASVNEAYMKMKKVLKDRKEPILKPCCFFADQDYIAIGAMQAVKELGYKVPEEAAFIGYDDIQACEACVPGLTSLRINNTELGKLAVKRLIGKIENSTQVALRVFVPATLVERDSVGDLSEGNNEVPAEISV